MSLINLKTPTKVNTATNSGKEREESGKRGDHSRYQANQITLKARPDTGINHRLSQLHTCMEGRTWHSLKDSSWQRGPAALQAGWKGREEGLGQTNPEVAKWHPGSPQARWEDKKEQSRVHAQLSSWVTFSCSFCCGGRTASPGRGQASGPIEGNFKDWVMGGQAGPTSKFLMLLVFFSMAFRVEGEGEEDEVRVVEWGRVETKWVSDFVYREAQTLYSPGLITAKTSSQRGGWKAVQRLGWELFAVDEKFQVGTMWVCAYVNARVHLQGTNDLLLEPPQSLSQKGRELLPLTYPYH